MDKQELKALEDERKKQAKTTRFQITKANSAKSADGTWQSLIQVSLL